MFITLPLSPVERERARRAYRTGDFVEAFALLRHDASRFAQLGDVYAPADNDASRMYALTAYQLARLALQDRAPIRALAREYAGSYVFGSDGRVRKSMEVAMYDDDAASRFFCIAVTIAPGVVRSRGKPDRLSMEEQDLLHAATQRCDMPGGFRSHVADESWWVERPNMTFGGLLDVIRANQRSEDPIVGLILIDTARTLIRELDQGSERERESLERLDALNSLGLAASWIKRNDQRFADQTLCDAWREHPSYVELELFARSDDDPVKVAFARIKPSCLAQASP